MTFRELDDIVDPLTVALAGPFVPVRDPVLIVSTPGGTAKTGGYEVVISQRLPIIDPWRFWVGGRRRTRRRQRRALRFAAARVRLARFEDEVER